MFRLPGGNPREKPLGRRQQRPEKSYQRIIGPDRSGIWYQERDQPPEVDHGGDQQALNAHFGQTPTPSSPQTMSRFRFRKRSTNPPWNPVSRPVDDRQQPRIRGNLAPGNQHSNSACHKKKTIPIYTLSFQSLQVGLSIINSDYNLEAFLSAQK